MKANRLFFGGLLVLMLASCEGILNIEVVGDGIVGEPRQRFHAPFSAIEFYDDFTLLLQKGERQEIYIQADGNLQPYIQTEVVRGALIIRRSPNYSLIPREPIVITVKVPSLDQIEVFGGGRLILDSLQVDKLDLRVYARAQVNARELNVEQLIVWCTGGGSLLLEGQYMNLDLRQVGSGSCRLIGNCAAARLVQEGSGLVEARDLNADILKVGLYGSGLVYCRSLSYLGIEIEGSGRVFYRGQTPQEIKGPDNQVGTY